MSAVLRLRSGSSGGLSGFIAQTFAVVEADAHKLRRDPTELLTRAIQPALWLLLFGQVIAKSKAIQTGGVPYIDFIVPGILGQSILFVSIFYGLIAIWERDLGTLERLLVSPIQRMALVTGRSLSASMRAVVQAVIVYSLGLMLGAHLNLNPLALLGTLLVVIFGASLFSTLSLVVACIVKSRERFMGTGQGITMPLFFASNAIYPVAVMPLWLETVSRANPLTYQIDLMRSLMVVNGGHAIDLRVDVLVVVGSTLLLVVVAAKIYPRLTR